MLLVDLVFVFELMDLHADFFVFVSSKRNSDRPESEYTDKLQHYTSGHSMYLFLKVVDIKSDSH